MHITLSFRFMTQTRTQKYGEYERRRCDFTLLSLSASKGLRLLDPSPAMVPSVRCRTWLWGETGKMTQAGIKPMSSILRSSALTTKLLCLVKPDYNPTCIRTHQVDSDTTAQGSNSLQCLSPHTRTSTTQDRVFTLS